MSLCHHRQFKWKMYMYVCKVSIFVWLDLTVYFVQSNTVQVILMKSVCFCWLNTHLSHQYQLKQLPIHFNEKMTHSEHFM